MPDFEVDDDVIGTQASLYIAEGELGRPMDPAGAKYHGFGVFHREFFEIWGELSVPKSKFGNSKVRTVNRIVIFAEANPSPKYLIGTVESPKKHKRFGVLVFLSRSIQFMSGSFVIYLLGCSKNKSTPSKGFVEFDLAFTYSYSVTFLN